MRAGRDGIDAWGGSPGLFAVYCTACTYMLMSSSDGDPAWSRSVAEGYYRFDVLRK